MTLAAGSRLGPYELVAPLGAGGMGEVWRARDTRLGRDVAIKVLPERIASDPDALARFEREARAVAALSHPNILGIFDVGSEGGTSYVVTELLEGQTLRERLAVGAIPARKAAEYGAQIARGLGAAHEKGIVHRDVKPENVFVTSDGRVKVLDFGLARQKLVLPGGDDTRSPTVALETEPGMVMGTVGYMSPEQVRGEPADARSDVFSFGAVLYEMLSGRRAFSRPTGAETMTAILKEDPPEIAVSGVELPRSLADILRHCLEKNPGERFQSARDLAFDLEHTLGSSTDSPARGVAASPRRTLRLPAALALALALAALALFAGTRLAKPAAPRFRQLTFHRGYIESARFSPDGQTVFYGSTRRDVPLRVYSARLDSIESTVLDLPSSTVLGMSRTGEMALLLGCVHRGYWIRSGTLARVSIGGGSPREVLERVTDADISADGQSFAVVREVGTRQRLEFPIGKVLFETDGYVSAPRISRDGRDVAFLEHPFYGNDAGYVSVVRAGGKVERLTGLSRGLNGLAWSADGKEVWYSGNEYDEKETNNGSRYVLWAARPDQTTRIVFGPPMNLRLHDISASGTVLLAGEDIRGEIGGFLKGDARDRDLSTWSDEMVTAISEDGSMYVGIEQSAPGAGVDPVLYYRRAGETAPVRLGTGTGIGITPDGRRIANVIRKAEKGQLVLVPTGAGDATTIDTGVVQVRVAANERPSWSSDGKKMLFPGFEPGHRPRAWLIDVPKGEPRAITPEGESHAILSPDGGSVVNLDATGRIFIYRVAGGDPVEVHGASAGEEPIQWDASGRGIYVWDRRWPAEVGIVDLATGRRTPWREIAPDPVGALYGNLILTRDGQHYAYRIRRVLSELNLAEGLK